MLRINKHCLDVMVLTLLGEGVVAEQLTGLKTYHYVVSLDKKIYSTKGESYRCLKRRVIYTEIKLLIKSVLIIMRRLMTEDQTKKELCLACHKPLYWALCT